MCTRLFLRAVDWRADFDRPPTRVHYTVDKLSHLRATTTTTTRAHLYKLLSPVQAHNCKQESRSQVRGDLIRGSLVYTDRALAGWLAVHKLANGVSKCDDTQSALDLSRARVRAQAAKFACGQCDHVLVRHHACKLWALPSERASDGQLHANERTERTERSCALVSASFVLSYLWSEGEREREKLLLSVSL